MEPSDERIRLQKFLRDRGLGSRRRTDALVQGGRIKVNGEAIREATRFLTIGDKVEAEGQTWTVERTAPPAEHYRFFKPMGLVCTRRDEYGRRTIYDHLRSVGLTEEDGPLIYAGRLDAESRGLLILSRDGGWVDRLIHPRANVEKEYIASTDRRIEEEALRSLSSGSVIEGEAYGAFRYEILEPGVVKMILTEGKKREVRRILEKAGVRVVDLLRTRIGGYDLQGLREGEWQRLEEN